MTEHNAITLTPALIQQWRDSHASIIANIAVMREQASVLERKIEAASFLLPPAQEAGTQTRASVGSDDEKPSLVAKIVDAVVSAEGRLLTPGQIKNVLIVREQYPDGSSPNYFYSALKRAVERGAIHAQDGKYYATSGSKPD